MFLGYSHPDALCALRRGGYRKPIFFVRRDVLIEVQTFATLQTFFLAMFLYPEVQTKAQAELDAVVGPNRLPDHSDMPHLPYISAIVKESMRWLPVLPLSIPHRTTEDIECDGYFIPAGTILLPNSGSALLIASNLHCAS